MLLDLTEDGGQAADRLHGLTRATPRAHRGPVDASSILGLMTLGAKHGDEVVLTAEGEGAEAALDALAEFVRTDLDAD